LNAAATFGDDSLQRSANGTVRPETFNHGTSQQRTNWFKAGFTSGKIDTCDTFNAEEL
jgi:predicted metalloprotease